jgi:hypothetical protein
LLPVGAGGPLDRGPLRAVAVDGRDEAAEREADEDRVLGATPASRILPAVSRWIL